MNIITFNFTIIGHEDKDHNGDDSSYYDVIFEDDVPTHVDNFINNILHVRCPDGRVINCQEKKDDLYIEFLDTDFFGDVIPQAYAIY